MKVTKGGQGGQGGQGGPGVLVIPGSEEPRGNQRKPLDTASRFVHSAAFFFLFNHRLRRLRRFPHDLRDYSASAVSRQPSCVKLTKPL